MVYGLNCLSCERRRRSVPSEEVINRWIRLIRKIRRVRRLQRFFGYIGQWLQQNYSSEIRGRLREAFPTGLEDQRRR